MLIYKITNQINNKVYIGQTTSKTFNRRWTQHKTDSKNPRHSDNHLYRAMNKYGINNFSIEVLFECSNKIELNIAEIDYINEYDSRNPIKGYNRSVGGNLGGMSKEGQQRASLKAIARWKDSAYRTSVINNRKGKCVGSDNHNFGKPGFMLGKTFSDSHKQKISNALLGNKNGNFKEKKSIRCVETGEVFVDINQLRIKFPKGNIYKAIRQKTKSNGLHWEYVTDLSFKAEQVSI